MTGAAISNNLMQKLSSKPSTAQTNSQEASLAWQGILLGLLVGFLPMAAGCAIAHLMGLNPSLYGDLKQQAITAGMVTIPFAIYCVVIAAKSSTKAFGVTSALMSALVGLILAAVV